MTDGALTVVAFAATVVLTPVAIVLARLTGIMDRPGPLKPQVSPVPYLGGLAVFFGISVGALAGRPTVILPLLLALGLGVMDDRLDIAPWARLVGQVAVGIAIVVTSPVHVAGAAGVVLIVGATVVTINGMNLLDGLDMLASGVTAVAAVGFAVALHGPGRPLALALAAAAVAFLLYNRPPARIYLGDGGSYLIGAALTVLLADTWAPRVAASVGIAALAFVAVPVSELAFAIVRRARGHQSLVAGDRGHPYDRLVRIGWPVPAVNLAYVLSQAVLVVLGLVAVHLVSMPASALVVVLTVLLLTVSAAFTGSLAPDNEVQN